MSEIKSKSPCLFVGGSLHGKVISIFGEQIRNPVVDGEDGAKGIGYFKYEQYLSARVILSKEKKLVKVMRISSMCDADLVDELKNWEFASDGIFRIQTCPNYRGEAVGGHIDCPTCEGAGTVRVDSRRAGDA